MTKLQTTLILWTLCIYTSFAMQVILLITVIKRISNNDSEVTRTAYTLTQATMMLSQEDDEEFDEAIKVKEDVEPIKSTQESLLEDSFVAEKNPLAQNCRKCSQLYCSDAGYLDYVGLFFDSNEVDIYLTPKEETHTDILSRIHAHGMGGNKNYKEDRRTRSELV